MFETTWDVNGKHIELATEYLGDKPAPWDRVNENHNIVYVSVDSSPEECFDAWGSRVNPQFDDEYDLKNIFQLICDDGLTAIWGDWDDVLYEVDGRRAVEIVDGMRDTAAKRENLGLDEDDLQKIVNDEEWQ